MKVTARKIEANRRNALKSTGPRTENGKKKSRYNALKHGILAKEVDSGRGRRPAPTTEKSGFPVGAAPRGRPFMGAHMGTPLQRSDTPSVREHFCREIVVRNAG